MAENTDTHEPEDDGTGEHVKECGCVDIYINGATQTIIQEWYRCDEHK